MRKAAQIAGAAALAAILLSGCGSSGDSNSGNKDGKQPEPTAPTAPDGAGKPADGGSLDGAWQTESAGDPLILAISNGTVALSQGHKTACLGKVEKMGGMAVAALKCTTKDDTRTMGTLTPGSDGTSLTVSWKGGPTEKYARSTDGKVKIPDLPELPSGVPNGS
ncbi:hypothetical protein [Streptomyces pinistramenti]|uniref:hypothetical protein n=1 Tax=Streptomyces pinistramenti TaxID=2884812 RepID=UPI001D066A51|nr:hypothetical protein [Streptomyces pinistramenti]MCB5907905.1 hypothetical protein [Streptomyces pinistramenti]